MKASGKRKAGEYIQANWGSRPSEYSLKSVSAYSTSLAENAVVKKDLEKYRSLQFENILADIRAF
jgi:hypothetical protein